MPSRQWSRTPALAGWLFADLFLVLFVIALAAVPPASLTAHAKVSPPRQSAQPKSRKKPNKSTPPGVESTPTDICVSQATSALVADFDKQVQLKGLAGRKVGFILVFATGTDINAAVTEATAAFELIKNTDPDRVAFAGAGGEGLWGGSSDNCPTNGGTDNYHFQVFFYL
jgi:hypothetical protein